MSVFILFATNQGFAK